MEKDTFVTKEKYEKLKVKLKQWVKKCSELEDKLNIIGDVDNILDKFEKENEELKQKLEYVKLECNEEKEYNEKIIKKLMKKNKDYKEYIINIKKYKKIDDKNYRNTKLKIERELMLKDEKIQRMEDYKKELRERYNELKEDYRWSIDRNK